MRIELGEDTPILSKSIIDISNEVGSVAIEFVIIRTATTIATEFFICPTDEFVVALEAFFFHELCFSKKGLKLRELF